MYYYYTTIHTIIATHIIFLVLKLSTIKFAMLTMQRFHFQIEVNDIFLFPAANKYNYITIPKIYMYVCMFTLRLI